MTGLDWTGLEWTELEKIDTIIPPVGKERVEHKLYVEQPHRSHVKIPPP